MSDAQHVHFGQAKPGETAIVYDVSHLDWDHSWVADSEYFDDLDSDVTVKRQVWQLISEDEVTFPGWETRHREIYGDEE